MTTSLDWARDGSAWPNHDASAFVDSGGIRWHVQRIGRGPVLLCLHGTGAASHSFAPLAAELADRFTLVVPDFPGHGFSSSSRRPGDLALDALAAQVSGLVRTLGITPLALLGHSAGAAVAARMLLDGAPGRGLVALNPAIRLPANPRELPGWSLAEWIARQPFLARGIAALASQRGLVARMLRQNSPALPDDQVALYQRLWHSDRHVHAVFTMMAGWDVAPLRRSLGQLAVPTLLVSGANDPWFPPRLVEALAAELPRATHITLPSAGHLSHEERPTDVARAIRAFVATL
jgi:magnesium chelatase accessory protein